MIEMYHFGDGFTLDTSGRALARHGKPIDLESRPLEILIHMVEHHEKLFNIKTYKEIFDITVSPGTLKGYISVLRDALGDREACQLIYTAKGLGYKFRGEIRERAKTATAAAEPDESPRLTAPGLIARAQKVKWGRNDGLAAGIRVWDAREDASVGTEFIPWTQLYDEITQNLRPQVLANPAGYDFELHDYNGKKDWLVFLVDQKREWYCDVWFGGNADDEWTVDGLVRFGDRDKTPRTWQTWQRYSDGTYLRVPGKSLCNSVDQMKLQRV